MATALRSLGPEAVLAVLPLNIREGLMQQQQQAGAGGASPAPAVEARTWMLPLLRRHVRGARLSFWASDLLPLARFLGGRAAAASAAGQRLHALNCHTLERQAWAALPAFCSWPRDAAQAYPPLAAALAAAARQREDLRPLVCSALERLARQARAVVLLAGDPEGLFKHLELGKGVVGEGEGKRRRRGSAGGGESDDDDDESGDNAGAPSDDDSDDDDDFDDDDDEDDEDNPNPSRRSSSNMLAVDPRSCAADAHGKPGWWSAASHASPQLKALRQHGKDWLPLLLRGFLAAEPARRGPIAGAIAAVASVAEPSVTSALLQTALGRLARCARDAAAVAAGEPPAAADGPGGLVLEGGSTPAERVASHLDVCVCLSAGVPRGPAGKEALGAIFAAARPAVLTAAASGGGGGGNNGPNNNNSNAALLQKRGYKALASLAEARPEWLREQMAPLLELLLRGGPVVATAARRQRLRLLRAVLLALLSSSSSSGGGGASLTLPSATDLAPVLLDPATKRELVPGAAALADPSTPAEQRAPLLAAALVAELVLSTKEANRRAREAAYALLVEVAAEMHASRPPAARRAGGGASLMMQRMMGEDGEGEEGGSDDDDSDDEYAAAADAGGLSDFVNMVCAGLAGGSPHMISATVMALARLLHAFPAELGAAKGGAAPRLLSAVLTLLRSRAREVVKSVLGFCKVCAARLPADVLRKHLPQLLEGMLLWSDDSRNRFRLRVRAVVERLCRRLGVEEVSAAAPASEAKLLTHIRKQAARKARRREGGGASSAGGSQVSLIFWLFFGVFSSAFFFLSGGAGRGARVPQSRPPYLSAAPAHPRNALLHLIARGNPPAGRGSGNGRGHSARGQHGSAEGGRRRGGAWGRRARARAEQAASRPFPPLPPTPRHRPPPPTRPRGENPQAGARPAQWRPAPFDWAPQLTHTLSLTLLRVFSPCCCRRAPTLTTLSDHHHQTQTNNTDRPTTSTTTTTARTAAAARARRPWRARRARPSGATRASLAATTRRRMSRTMVAAAAKATASVAAWALLPPAARRAAPPRRPRCPAAVVPAACCATTTMTTALPPKTLTTCCSLARRACSAAQPQAAPALAAQEPSRPAAEVLPPPPPAAPLPSKLEATAASSLTTRSKRSASVKSASGAGRGALGATISPTTIPTTRTWPNSRGWAEWTRPCAGRRGRCGLRLGVVARVWRRVGGAARAAAARPAGRRLRRQLAEGGRGRSSGGTRTAASGSARPRAVREETSSARAALWSRTPTGRWTATCSTGGAASSAARLGGWLAWCGGRRRGRPARRRPWRPEAASARRGRLRRASVGGLSDRHVLFLLCTSE